MVPKTKRTLITLFFVAILCVLVIVNLNTPKLSGVEFTKEQAEEIDRLMDRIFKNGQIYGSVLLAIDGEVIYKKANGYADLEWKIPNTLDTRFRIASVTKPFTAMLILQLAQEGKLSLDGILSEYVPDYKGEKGSEITVDQLLTHRAGIIGEPRITDLDDIERHYYTRERLLEYISGEKLSYEPGTSREYSNFGYFLLGMIIERVSGKSYGELLQEKICGPAGMKYTIPDINAPIIEKRAAGYHYDYITGPYNSPILDMSFAFACGHLLSTVEDLYHFDQALYSDTLLSDKYKELFFNRYGWLYQRTPVGKNGKRIRANYLSGSINGFASHILRIEKDRIFICILKNMKERNAQIIIKWPEYVTSRMLAILYGEEYEMPKNSAAYAVFLEFLESGINAGVEKYRDIKENGKASYYFDEDEFVTLRDAFHEAGMVNEASEFYKLVQD